MNHQTRIYAAAIALQGARTFKTELAGIGKTPQGEEFAKAIAEAALDGIQPTSIAEQVAKAMAGNEAMALQLLEGVEELVKAHVEQHTRTLANGKTVNVHAYETARTAAMKATTNAHGATFHAMRMKNPEAHENAARMHEDAARQHEDAHKIHPMDVPEVGQEHANLKGQHQMAAEYHSNEAQRLRGEAEYSKHADRAATASALTKGAVLGHDTERLHRAAAEAHQKAHEANPKAGHGQKAESHAKVADAAKAAIDAAKSPHLGWGPGQNGKLAQAQGGRTASEEASKATQKAHASGKPEDHAAAAEAHANAADCHLTIHGEHESDEGGYQGKIAQAHIDLHNYHSKLAKGAPVAKAEGPMAITPTTTDLAKKEGGEALAVEGRPDEKDRKDDDLDGKGMTGEIGKAEVAAHTRTVGGKVVQVSAYETHRDAALAHTLAAHKASAYPDKMAPEGHTAAAAAHQKAAELQREAAKYAPEEWTKKGHEDQAKVHEHYAHAHGQKAAAAGQKADSGVDAKVHSAESVAALENHEDHQGYGYLGHSSRTPETDAQVAEAANRAGLSPHHLAAHLLSKSGRHLMDDHKTGSTPEEATAHFQRWMTDPKNEKAYGINDYAKDLEKRAPKPEAAAKK